MTKNILNNDGVHHVKNMMLSGIKTPMPYRVVLSDPTSASCLLSDGTTSLCKPFLPFRTDKTIKLNKTNKNRLL